MNGRVGRWVDGGMDGWKMPLHERHDGHLQNMNTEIGMIFNKHIKI